MRPDRTDCVCYRLFSARIARFSAGAARSPPRQELSLPGFLTTLAAIWRIAIPYFRSEDRLAGRILLASVIAMELGVVAITVLINQWNARFYNALQDRTWDAFVREISIFCLLAGTLIVVRVYQLYLNQCLQLRWRRFLTGPYLSGWAGKHS